MGSLLTKKKVETSKDNIKKWAGNVLYGVFLIVLVWFIITFVGQSTVVNGSSMYDTLENGDRLWVNKLSYRFSKPERFDIVVFPHKEKNGSSSYFIKRIIGLPGETVRMDEDGIIYINEEPLEEDYGEDCTGSAIVGMAGENITLGEDEYFVLGDNRGDSNDSRFPDVGNIHRDELVGKVSIRIWPFSKFGNMK